MRAERFETNERASLEIFGSSSSTVAELRNISVTGACLEWEDNGFQLSEGDLVRMTVDLQSLNRQHKVSGEVVWIDGRTTGVQFLKPNELVERIVGRTAA